MWSGPRNISTAMMRAFENRPDTVVVDEPLYAAYLARTGIDHPVREAVIASQPTGLAEAVATLSAPLPDGRRVHYAKHMAHHVERDMDLAWTLQQFRPQVLMIHTRAVATQYLQTEEFAAAIKEIEAGIERLREFYENHSQRDLASPSAEVSALQHWLEEVGRKRPLSKREQLEHDLHEAVKREDYEKAAKVRDALKRLRPDGLL